MEGEKELFKSPEKEPRHNEVIVDFLRHGEPEYSEEGTGLTSKGENQIRESATEIIKKIDFEKEKIVLWSSPAKRGQRSEEIIKEALNEKLIKAGRSSEISSMRNFEVKDWGFVKSLFGFEAKEKGISPEALYSKQERDKSDKLEVQEDVKKRAERVFNWIRYLAENADLGGKKLHIIGVSHYEFINPIIEDIFGPEIEGENYIKYGEDLNVKFNFNFQTKKTMISAEFRGKKIDNIVFDKEKRKFIVAKK